MEARRTGIVELGIRTTRGASLRVDLIRDRWLYLMLLVPLVHILVFLYIPMYGITIAFKEFNAFLGYWRSPWVGLKHFIRVFEDDHFWVAFLNTLKFGISSLVFGFPAPILFALLLNELRHRIYKGTVQTFLYIPNFISMVVIAGIIIDLLDPNSGLVNGLLVALGGQPIYFMVERPWFPADLYRLRDLADDRLRHDHLPGGDVRHRPAALRGGHHRRRQPGAAGLARHPARHPADHRHPPDPAHPRHRARQLREDPAALPADHLRRGRRHPDLHLPQGAAGRRLDLRHRQRFLPGRAEPYPAAHRQHREPPGQRVPAVVTERRHAD